MIELQSVRFRNFQSFGNNYTEVNLAKPGTTFVVGENLDQGGSSGAGKTAIISAISYCLFGMTPARTKNDKLINRTNDRKNTLMEVAVTFKRDDDVYTIRRTRGEQTTVQLLQQDRPDLDAKLTRVTYNGESYVDVTPDSVKHFAAKVRELVGFSFDLFSRIILFDGNSKPFLELPVGNQRDLIEELFNITMLSGKGRTLKEWIKELQKELDGHKILVKQQELAVQTYDKLLAEAAARVVKWETDRKQQLASIEQLLGRIVDVDFENEEQLHAESERLRMVLVDLSNRSSMTGLMLRQSEQNVQKKRGEHQHLTSGNCPYCLQKFDAPEKIAEIEAWLSTNVPEMEQLDMTLKRTLEEATIARNQREQLQGFIQHKDLTELKKIQSNAEALKAKAEELKVAVNPHVEAYESLKNQPPPAPDNAKTDALAKEIEHRQFLLKLLMDPKSFIRKDIVSKPIPYLNKRVAYYTDKLNLQHIVKFQPDMTCEVSEFNRELDPTLLSNGEKKRLNLSLCLAFRDVMSYLHSRVNILFTDEVDGGSLDARNVDSMIGVLKHKAWDDDLSIFIISHRPEFEGRCDRTLVVRKERGFSQLVDELEA